MALRAVFPGSFDPLTVAHVTMASTACDQVVDLVRVDLAMSHEPLGKSSSDQEPIGARSVAMRASTAHLDWLDVAVFEHRLVVDIAQGYDRVILGADKWEQLFDLQFYDDLRSRHASMDRLCPAIIFRRPGHAVHGLRPRDTVLDLPPRLRTVSSSAVRSGRNEWKYPPDRKA